MKVYQKFNENDSAHKQICQREDYLYGKMNKILIFFEYLALEYAAIPAVAQLL